MLCSDENQEVSIDVGGKKTTCLPAAKFERGFPVMLGRLAGKLPWWITVTPAGGCLPLVLSQATGRGGAHQQGCWPRAATPGPRRKALCPGRKCPSSSSLFLNPLSILCRLEKCLRSPPPGSPMRAKTWIWWWAARNCPVAKAQLISCGSQNAVLNTAAAYLGGIPAVEVLPTAKQGKALVSETYPKKCKCHSQPFESALAWMPGHLRKWRALGGSVSKEEGGGAESTLDANSVQINSQKICPTPYRTVWAPLSKTVAHKCTCVSLNSRFWSSDLCVCSYAVFTTAASYWAVNVEVWVCHICSPFPRLPGCSGFLSFSCGLYDQPVNLKKKKSFGFW